ncbi:hypothetical protein RDI58_015693 [Solanum bulbocastanum]|uniref:Uncharacterized protein n=1 Tax=Solanum bulbocastanum TaxID=147425 RepID=A0AAN8YF84_SOLBU
MRNLCVDYFWCSMNWRDLFLFVFVHSLCVFRRVWRSPFRYAMAFPVRSPYMRSSCFWHPCVIVRGSIQILGPTESGCRVRI